MKYVSQKERFEHLQQFKFDSRMINEGFVISNELKCLKKGISSFLGNKK